MIFTSFMRLGDFALVWPVASWYYKTNNEKIHWVLPAPTVPIESFNEQNNLFRVSRLLAYQDFTEKISFVPIPNPHPSKWEFNPNQFGIEGKYYNFGVWWIREFPYIPSVYAKRYGFGFDKNFIIKYREIPCESYDDVWIETAAWRDNIGSLKKIIPPYTHELKREDDFELNINKAMKAKRVWTNGGGFSIYMDLCKKSVIIHKTRHEFELGDKPVFRCLAFPGEGFPEHKYIWQ